MFLAGGRAWSGICKLVGDPCQVFRPRGTVEVVVTF